MRHIVNFLFEVGMLKKIPRSGYHFLGTGNESVADHSFRVAVIGYLLAKNEPDANVEKVVLMCLFHDLHEARTGDHNYVNRQYVAADEDRAINDLAQKLPFGPEMVSLTKEFDARETIEAQLAQDADQLDFLLELKRQLDLGNKCAAEWLVYSAKRLITDRARKLADEIVTTNSSDWWFEKDEELWVNGPGKTLNRK